MKQTTVALGPLAIFFLLAASIPAAAKPKPPAPCKVYFAVVQRDPSLPNGQARGLNPPQKKWYAKHGDRGNLAGICYDPAKATYLIRWSESRHTQYYLYTTQEPTYGTGGGETGATPVEHTQELPEWQATGFLFRVGKGGSLTPVAPLTGHHLLAFSASRGLLQNGLEAIARAEKAKGKAPSAAPHR